MIARLPFSLATLLVATLMLGACASTSTKPKEGATTKQVESHYRLGLDALEKNNLPKAFDELLHAEQLNAKRADVLDALGYAWRLRGNLEKSHEYYRRALAIDPAARTWNNYGTLLLAMDKPKEAESAFKKALDDPRYPRPDFAYINLGDALLMQDRLNDAIAAYRQARMLNPLQETSRLKEAAAYREHDRPAFAKAMYETILRDSPANRQALEGLLSLLQEQRDNNEARRQLRQFIKLTPEPMDRAWAEETLKAIQP
jgi:type IV pilus biogenesis/stability protein PilW